MKQMEQRPALTTRKRVIEDLHDRLEGRVRKYQIEAVIEQLGEQIAEEIMQRGAYRLMDLGTLRAFSAPTRPGVNPRNGSAVTIPAHQELRFRASATFKRRINGDGSPDREGGG